MNSRIHLKQGRAKPLWFGHPWVFSGAIQRREGPEDAVLAEVYDHQGRLIGTGFHNPHSQILVRLLTVGSRLDVTDVQGALCSRIRDAAACRRLLGLPNDATNAYRLIHAEGDRLPGLIADVLDDTAVIQLHCRSLQPFVEAIANEILATAGCRRVIERVADDAARLEGFVRRGGCLIGPADPGRVTIREVGLSFEVDPFHDQKTGFYLDQRENRRVLATHSAGRRVLDAFSYHGGFALHALRAGASRVVCVDISERALKRVHDNVRRNGLQPVQTVCGDALAVLPQMIAASERHDIVVLDPPKFARSRPQVEKALRAHTRLHEYALQLVSEDGGLIVTCSCSQHVSADSLLRSLNEASIQQRRHVRVVHMLGQAPDHPFGPSFPQGRYLDCVVGVVG